MSESDDSSKVFLKDVRPGTQTTGAAVQAQEALLPASSGERLAYKSTGPDDSGVRMAYKSTGPDDSPPPDSLPSQNPASSSGDGASGSSSGSTSTADSTVVRTIDGKLVTGYATNNGGFASSDGTVYVPAGKAAEYGITDPGTGNFLPGGTTRVIGGQTVYGTVQNGMFVSEDGTLLQLSSGFVEHGTTDASGNFLAETTINGQVVQGNYSDNGDFMSQDGKIYVPAGKAAEYGITDPGTGSFLPGGTTRVINGQTMYGTVQNGDFISEDGTVLQLPNGFVENGKTDANGNFTAYATVNGQQVWGNYGTDGSFMSTDGTVYIPAGKAAEYGITDPGTGNFLPGGTTRVINGQTVYGTVLQGGDFISEDGTMLQMPNGFVEHGSVNASGDFIAEMTINGQQVQGNYASDGSFMSTTGTIYVPPGGAPEYGVTDPATNSFLPGGTTYTLSGGTVLYGYKEPDGSFWSYNGSEIVLSNGQAVSGSLQKGDGIFTGSNGNDYFVGQNGIVQVTPNKDGSFTMPNGSVVMTPASWKTDLSAFQDAQNQIGTYISNISDDYDNIQTQYSMIESFWTSPAGTSFTEATTAVDYAMQQLNTVLSSITSAMQASYNNYYASEQQAITTFNANSTS